MHSTGLVALALLGSAAAQSTISLFMLGFSGQSLQASFMGSDATASTYFVTCGPMTDDSEGCGVGPGVTAFQGPSTAGLSMVEEGEFTGAVHCNIQGTTSGVCTASFGGPGANDAGVAVSTLTGSDMASAFLPVVVTAGAAQVTASTGASATAPTATPTTLTSSASSDSKQSAVSGMATATATATSTSSSKAAGAQITGHAQWAVGGAAMALAMAAM